MDEGMKKNQMVSHSISNKGKMNDNNENISNVWNWITILISLDHQKQNHSCVTKYNAATFSEYSCKWTLSIEN